MVLKRSQWLGAGAAALLYAGAAGSAQQMPIGSVSTLDATVTGASSVANDRAQLGTNGTIVAKDHVAFVQLIRGGSVKVCATSGVHLTAGTPSTAPPDAGPPAATAPGATVAQNDAAPAVVPAAVPATWAANIPPPLMVALDRGAMELRMGAISGDVLMTPDLRFSFSGEGLLDVHIRVARNGDTCVENRVSGLAGHPSLKVGSLFGNETYDVLPGQHVLFEAGNLHEVVDNESSPCGCPEASAKPTAVGDLALKKSPKTSGTEAAALHPFPADVSQGLAPAPPSSPAGTRTQIATTLAYNATPDGLPATAVPGAAPVAAVGAARVPAARPASPPERPGFFHSIGRFFRRIF